MSKKFQQSKRISKLSSGPQLLPSSRKPKIPAGRNPVQEITGNLRFSEISIFPARIQSNYYELSSVGAKPKILANMNDPHLFPSASHAPSEPPVSFNSFYIPVCPAPSDVAIPQPDVAVTQNKWCTNISKGPLPNNSTDNWFSNQAFAVPHTRHDSSHRQLPVPRTGLKTSLYPPDNSLTNQSSLTETSAILSESDLLINGRDDAWLKLLQQKDDEIHELKSKLAARNGTLCGSCGVLKSATRRDVEFVAKLSALLHRIQEIPRSNYEDVEIRVLGEVTPNTPQRDLSRKVELVEGSGVYIRKAQKASIVMLCSGKPRAMIRAVLSAIYGDTELQNMSALGKRKSRGIPTKVLEAIQEFVMQHCTCLDGLTLKYFNKIINTACYASRRRLALSK